VQKEAGQSGEPTCELPTRTALTARLEAQRAELLRVMEFVNRARRTLEEQIARHSLTFERQQQLLDTLDNAKQSLATAYPMLVSIAEALHVDEILNESAS
jgi:multidrug efflux pump subunit AcrA (membrane-fusion protein)